MDTGKSLRKTGISPSGKIPSCPHNALLEILSRNHARVVPDGFLRNLPVSRLALSLILFTAILAKMDFFLGFNINCLKAKVIKFLEDALFLYRLITIMDAWLINLEGVR